MKLPRLEQQTMCRLPDVKDHRQLQKLSKDGYFTFKSIRYTLERQSHRPDNRAGANHHSRHLFLSSNLQVVTHEVHNVVCEAVDVPCSARNHIIVLTLLIISDCYPLPDPYVCLSILVCDIEHTSVHFSQCGRKFVLCLFVQCQLRQEVQIMDEASLIPPAPTTNLQTFRKP